MEKPRNNKRTLGIVLLAVGGAILACQTLAALIFVPVNVVTREVTVDLQEDLEAERLELEAELADVQAELEAEQAALNTEMAEMQAELAQERAALAEELKQEQLAIEAELEQARIEAQQAQTEVERVRSVPVFRWPRFRGSFSAGRDIFAAMLIVGGIILLARRQKSAPQTVPATGPEADRPTD